MSVLFVLLISALPYARSIVKTTYHGSTNFETSCFNTSCSDAHGNFCPPGLFCVDGHCECGVYPDYIIICNGTNAKVLNSYCATFDQVRNLTSVGACLQITKETDNKTDVYLTLSSVNQLHEELCGLYNRTGTLCGKCLPDHYPLAYSYDTSCIPCPNAHWNWLRYIMGAYIPLTLFFLIIIFFKINTTSSHLFAVVFFCQTIAMPIMLRSIFQMLRTDANSAYYLAAKTVFSLYGIWNLDFFRLFYSDLCLGMGLLPTLALDYAIAVYPLILLVMAYLVIYLHDKNFRVVRVALIPFAYLFTVLKNRWNIRTSMVDAFATFFLLSNIKFLSVSFDLLFPTQIYELHRDHYEIKHSLYYTAEVSYFGEEHLPYGVLAVAMLSIFVFFPLTVLALYPFKWFQKFLTLFPIRWHALHTFVDAFCGCYKDGTKPGTPDYRWFVSIFFVLRVLQFLLYFLPIKVMYNHLITVALVFYTTLFAVLQPFKSSASHLNSVHILFLQALSTFSLATLGISISQVHAPDMIDLFYVLATLSCILPFMYFFARCAYWVYSVCSIDSCRMHGNKVRRESYTRLVSENIDRISTSDYNRNKNLSSLNS